MKESLHISNYCLIRNSHLITGQDHFFAGKETAFPDFIKETYRHFNIGYPKFFKMDNLSKLGFLAAELLLKDRDLNLDYGKDGTGIILANASASLDTDRIYQASIADRSNYFPSPSVFVYTLPNIVMGEISIRHKLFGENAFFIKQTFDPVFMVEYVKHLFENQIVACCITGWVEMDSERYEAVLFLVEKTGPLNNGIAIFDVRNVDDIYCLKL
ncbi:MAG: hypothetical protein JXA61_00185 [Bacteroidales bacterium]|nr:hypothetical protein [Bacteroidales bacterium]